MKSLIPHKNSLTAPELKTLSGRQNAVLKLLVQGRSNLAIAAKLEIDVSTVETHLRRMFKKLGIHSRAQAVALVIRTTDKANKVLGSFPNSRARHESRDLSGRQQATMELLMHGYSNLKIASKLQVSDSTVTTHLRRIFKKLGVHSRAQAVAKIARFRLFDSVDRNYASARDAAPASQIHCLGMLLGDGRAENVNGKIISDQAMSGFGGKRRIAT